MARKTDLTPAAARNHPSLKDWISTETNVEWLKSLIVDPRFLAVCHYVQDKNQVTVQLSINTAHLQANRVNAVNDHSNVIDVAPHND